MTSVSNGDIGGAINSVLNMPGFVVNALLNAVGSTDGPSAVPRLC